jgi:hypothetical protein
MAAGRNEFVAMMVVELEDGDSYSDVGYQDVDEGGSDVTSHQTTFQFSNGVQNIMQPPVRPQLA